MNDVCENVQRNHTHPDARVLSRLMNRLFHLHQLLHRNISMYVLGCRIVYSTLDSRMFSSTSCFALWFSILVSLVFSTEDRMKCLNEPWPLRYCVTAASISIFLDGGFVWVVGWRNVDHCCYILEQIVAVLQRVEVFLDDLGVRGSVLETIARGGGNERLGGCSSMMRGEGGGRWLVCRRRRL